MNQLLPLTQLAPAAAPMDAAALADHSAASAFLNALLREWDGWSALAPGERASLEASLPDGFAAPGGEILKLPLAGGGALLIHAPARTPFRTAVRLPFGLMGADGSLRKVPLATALTLLITDPVASAGDPALQMKLLQRVMDSRLAAEAAFRARPPLGPASGWTFQQGEQALTGGHATHPNPRSRDGLDLPEARRFAPDLGGCFPLFWCLAHRSILVLASGTLTPAEQMLRALADSDPSLPQELRQPEDGFVPLPWHPFQAPKLLARTDVIALLREGLLRPMGELGQPFAATGSFRGVHAWHAPSMLKFSLSLRLTNSRRTLARKEVERGLQLAELLDGPIGESLATEFPKASILREPAYVALKDADGGALEESFVVLRDNPFRDETAAGPVMMAGLCEQRPDGASPLGELILARAARNGSAAEDLAESWLQGFLDVAIHPLLEIRARYGLLFGAHQQNMTLALDQHGWPAHLWLRDCQGTGHLTTHHEMLARHLPDIGRHAENVVPPELGDGLFCYYVIVNNLMSVIATLVLDGLITEERANRCLLTFLQREKAQSRGDTSLHDFLLNRPTWVSKGNYRTSLSNVNEASGDGSGQLAAFLEMPNPLLPLTRADGK
ncbi:IucA/IucC family protein [Pannonibacter phragmitetus]|uniref:IucA/IucC family protein n=1 Tax=Pannonibacter phragmitetus TaxID=121719 RepID=UPI000F039182|nr:IucA/IucC family protein [Pannonibacter phragmitetus]